MPGRMSSWRKPKPVTGTGFMVGKIQESVVMMLKMTGKSHERV